MKVEQVEKAQSLLKEIKDLKKHKDFKMNTKHFEIRPHYGDTDSYDRICIPTRYNEKMLNTIKEIILEMELELEKM